MFYEEVLFFAMVPSKVLLYNTSSTTEDNSDEGTWSLVKGFREMGSRVQDLGCFTSWCLCI